MKILKRNEKGLLSLEACIAVTIFIFLMLFMYSFFVVFEVRNEMAHVTLATANSLSFDSFENNGDEPENIGQVFDQLFGSSQDTFEVFTDNSAWHTQGSAEIINVVKERFIAYLTAGGRGSDAEEILKRYHVVNGVNGLDFSGTYIADGKLYLSVKYEIEYEFKVFNLGNNKFEHKACSKLWSSDENSGGGEGVTPEELEEESESNLEYNDTIWTQGAASNGNELTQLIIGDGWLQESYDESTKILTTNYATNPLYDPNNVTKSVSEVTEAEVKNAIEQAIVKAKQYVSDWEGIEPINPVAYEIWLYIPEDEGLGVKFVSVKNNMIIDENITVNISPTGGAGSIAQIS